MQKGTNLLKGQKDPPLYISEKHIPCRLHDNTRITHIRKRIKMTVRKIILLQCSINHMEGLTTW